MTEHDTLSEAITEEVQSLRETVRELRGKLDQLNRKREEQRKQAIKMLDMRDRMARTEELENEVDELRERLDRAAESNENRRQQCRELQRERNTLQAKLDAYTTDEDTAEQHQQQLERELDYLRTHRCANDCARNREIVSKLRTMNASKATIKSISRDIARADRDAQNMTCAGDDGGAKVFNRRALRLRNARKRHSHTVDQCGADIRALLNAEVDHD